MYFVTYDRSLYSYFSTLMKNPEGGLQNFGDFPSELFVHLRYEVICQFCQWWRLQGSSQMHSCSVDRLNIFTSQKRQHLPNENIKSTKSVWTSKGIKEEKYKDFLKRQGRWVSFFLTSNIDMAWDCLPNLAPCLLIWKRKLLSIYQLRRSVGNSKELTDWLKEGPTVHVGKYKCGLKKPRMFVQKIEIPTDDRPKISADACKKPNETSGTRSGRGTNQSMLLFLNEWAVLILP